MPPGPGVPGLPLQQLCRQQGERGIVCQSTEPLFGAVLTAMHLAKAAEQNGGLASGGHRNA